MSTTARPQAQSASGISTWTIDAAHSSVGFSVKHMMISTVRGQFGQVEGTIQFDPAQPESAAVTARIATDSVTTFNESRDAHLRSNDFFNAEQYPFITFQSTKVEAAGEDRFRVYGDLTIRDVTQPVVLDAEYEGQIRDAYGMQRAAFTATTEISRKAFGVTWNAAIEGGGVAVGDTVKITLHIAAVRES